MTPTNSSSKQFTTNYPKIVRTDSSSNCQCKCHTIGASFCESCGDACKPNKPIAISSKDWEEKFDKQPVSEHDRKAYHAAWRKKRTR